MERNGGTIATLVRRPAGQARERDAPDDLPGFTAPGASTMIRIVLRSLTHFTRAEGIDAAAAMALVPAAILVHEFSHLCMGLLIGVPAPHLHFASFTHGPAPGLEPGQVAAIIWAGPVATLALAIGSVLFVGSHRRWCVALGIAAGTRLFILLPFAAAALRRRAAGVSPRPTTIDEDLGAHLLGLPGDLSLVAVAAIFVAVLVVLWRRRFPLSCKGFLLGAVLGWAAWMGMLGPAMLP